LLCLCLLDSEPFLGGKRISCRRDLAPTEFVRSDFTQGSRWVQTAVVDIVSNTKAFLSCALFLLVAKRAGAGGIVAGSSAPPTSVQVLLFLLAGPSLNSEHRAKSLSEVQPEMS